MMLSKDQIFYGTVVWDNEGIIRLLTDRAQWRQEQNGRYYGISMQLATSIWCLNNYIAGGKYPLILIDVTDASASNAKAKVRFVPLPCRLRWRTDYFAFSPGMYRWRCFCGPLRTGTAEMTKLPIYKWKRSCKINIYSSRPAISSFQFSIANKICCSE